MAIDVLLQRARPGSAQALTLILGMAALCGGCASSYHARSVDITEATLVEPAVLSEGTGDQFLYRYVKPEFDAKRYRKIIIEPVLVSKDGTLNRRERQNYQALANNAFVYLNEELGKDYLIVTVPDDATLRIQMAITDADSSKPVRNTLSTIIPAGWGVNLLKYGATGKQSGVGEITGEFRLTDAQTGELLAAGLDRRVGGKELTTLWSRWANADAGLKYWVQRLSFELCEQRGEGVKCVQP